MTDVLIAGGGGFGSEVRQYLLDLAAAGRDVRIAGVLDDVREVPVWEAGDRVLGTTDGFDVGQGRAVVLALGDPAARRAVAGRLRSGPWFTLVHPTAWVAPTAELGPGCVVCPFAFVGPHARLGAYAVVNVYASVGHHAVLGDCGVLSPYATLNGYAELGAGVLMGTHASVLGGVKIGEWSRVAAGAAVYRDVGPRSLAAGNPARAREMFAPPEPA